MCPNRSGDMQMYMVTETTHFNWTFVCFVNYYVRLYREITTSVNYQNKMLPPLIECVLAHDILIIHVNVPENLWWVLLMCKICTSFTF